MLVNSLRILKELFLINHDSILKTNGVIFLIKFQSIFSNIIGQQIKMILKNFIIIILLDILFNNFFV